MKVENFLNDKFFEISDKLRSIHETKKKLSEEFKKVYDKYLLEKKTLEEEAADLIAQIEDSHKEEKAKEE